MNRSASKRDTKKVTVKPTSESTPINETDFCNYQQHLCHREKLHGYDFCSRHILEDKSAPYKQCSFNYKTHRRCHRPAPKSDKKDGYCAEHSRKALMARQKTTRKRPADVATRCLEDLSRYKKEKIETVQQEHDPPTVPVMPGSKAQRRSDLFQIVNSERPSLSNRQLEDVSDVESADESPMVDGLWAGDADSDAESVDSDMEDPLKHAGCYSPEEVIRIMRDKLIRLQKLYIDQFQRLQYLLREERRQYLVNVRKEKESLMSIHDQPKDTPEERSAYEKIKALNHYQKPHGLEAVLSTDMMIKRLQAASSSHAAKPPQFQKCTFNITSNTKCGENSVPMAKYCMKHILNDTEQVLFRRCSFTTSDDGPCETPIADLFDGATCVYHTQVPQQYNGEQTHEAS